MMPSEAITILLAEDDDGHALLIERNLARAGFVNRIVRVSDGQQALDYIDSQGTFADRPMDNALLVLLDINMPRVDGVEVLTQLKSRERTAPIPVMMLTTTDDPREIERCYELGCSVYITKPVEYDAFVETIRRMGLFLQVVRVPEMERNAS